MFSSPARIERRREHGGHVSHGERFLLRGQQHRRLPGLRQGDEGQRAPQEGGVTGQALGPAGAAVRVRAGRA